MLPKSGISNSGATSIRHRLALDRTRVADRTETVLLDRARVGVAHDLVAGLVQECAADTLLDERPRRLALAEAREARLADERGKRRLEARVDRGRRHLHGDALGAGSGF
jgi:hypothetical protein